MEFLVLIRENHEIDQNAFKRPQMSGLVALKNLRTFICGSLLTCCGPRLPPQNA